MKSRAPTTPARISGWRDNIVEVALDNLAAGIDPANATIVIQSKMPAIADLTVYFMKKRTRTPAVSGVEPRVRTPAWP